jgi:hypothetical protein
MDAIAGSARRFISRQLSCLFLVRVQMSQLIGAVVAIFLLALPVRIAASLFDARRKTWGASIMVLLLGGVILSATFGFAPEEWLTRPIVLFGLIFGIFFVVSGFVLDIKLWQAAVLSLLISVVYGFCAGPSGVFGIKLHI